MISDDDLSDDLTVVGLFMPTAEGGIEASIPQLGIAVRANTPDQLKEELTHALTVTHEIAMDLCQYEPRTPPLEWKHDEMFAPFLRLEVSNEVFETTRQAHNRMQGFRVKHVVIGAKLVTDASGSSVNTGENTV